MSNALPGIVKLIPSRARNNHKIRNGLRSGCISNVTTPQDTESKQDYRTGTAQAIVHIRMLELL